MEERDQQILSYLATYRVGIRYFIDRCFFEGRSCANVLQRLRNHGLIQEVEKLPGGYACYGLTPQGAGLAGASQGEFGPQTLHVSLAALWFCHVNSPTAEKRLWTWEDPRRRQPVPRPTALLGPQAPNGSHCVQVADENTRLFRLYVPAPATPLKRAFREIQAQIANARECPMADEMIWSRAYGFMVLVADENKRMELERMTKEGGNRAPGGLQQEAYVRVEYAPDPQRLGGAIEELQSIGTR